MSSRFKKFPRSLKSWVIANIIIDLDLFAEYKIWRIEHPSIKSNYRAGNLFLLNKKKRYHIVVNPIKGLNMDSLEDFYYE